MISDNIELFKTYNWTGRTVWDVYIFIARNCKKTQKQKLESGEKIKILKLDFDEFIEIVSSDKFGNKEISNDFYRMKHNKEKLEKLKERIFRKTNF